MAHCPRWVAGRTLSIYSALSSGGIAAGSWLWGMVAENYSLTLALESSAGALLLVAATGLLLPIRQWKETDQDPFGFETPQLALELKSRSGPIVVKIEYSIPEANVETFLDLMRAFGAGIASGKSRWPTGMIIRTTKYTAMHKMHILPCTKCMSRRTSRSPR